MKLVFKVVLALAFGIMPTFAETPDKPDLFASINARKYTLGPNDVINVSMLGVPDVSKDSVKVQPDGKVNLSGVGSVYASGMTLDELAAALEEKFAYYVRNPKVAVSLQKTRPFIVQVTGAVNMPGSYEINTDTETTAAFYDDNTTYVERKTPILSNILTAAKGVNYDADVEHVVISNKFDGSKFEVNLLEFLTDGNTGQDIYLMPGDSVHVPRLPSPLAVDSQKYEQFRNATFTDKEVPVRVIGYVNNPGLITLDSSISSGLNTAIAQAGGYLGDSPYPPKKILVSRYSNNGKLVTTAVNPMQQDINLMPNDVVYVPEKARPMFGRAFDFISRIVEPANTVAGGYNNWSLMFDPRRFSD